MEMPEVMRTHRNALGWSQAELAERVGVDKRQIRRYEAGETQPALNVARSIARALSITVDELAGEESHRPDLTGEWWACWQSWQDGRETINPQRIAIRPLKGDIYQVATVTRGTPLEEGGYTWQGELRLWDDDVLMGWYVGNEAAVRSKGTMYFVLHTHGRRMAGRWVGKSHDGDVMTGLGAIARTEEDVMALIDELKKQGGAT
ncbi:helix-turn-helix transcriptional regulator [Kineococcus arenarius]|uniref:helix-turn-helix transcriptional regulator n=2 Tax=Kineococcus TaxID=33981 RepID=UPI003D7D33EE